MRRWGPAYWLFCVWSNAAEFRFADFASTSGIQFAGNAEAHRGVLRLTPAVRQVSGAAWFATKQAVGNGFDTTFRFQLTEPGGLGDGADGFAFVMQNAGPKAVAGRGASGGFALGDGYGKADQPGIPNSLAVFFDTHRNREASDPSDNYVAVCTNGKLREMRWPPPRLAATRKLKVKLKDEQPHTARVVFKPPILSVFLDDEKEPILSSAVDVSPYTDSNGLAYVGFTASTGSGYENHDILSWSFTSDEFDSASDLWMVSSKVSFYGAACLEGRNLCTPDRAVVEQTAEDSYHIVLPANLEWGASIPNPGNRRVAISNAHGTVCWDLERSGPEGCGGPAVALAMKTVDDKTYFSVKDLPGKAFTDNQGFFEFDVQMQ